MNGDDRRKRAPLRVAVDRSERCIRRQVDLTAQDALQVLVDHDAQRSAVWCIMELSVVQISKILTRTSGFLTSVTSHSLQPYRGCALGNSLCGVGCYVRHSWYTTRGREWGSFVETRENAALAYMREFEAERKWAREHRGRFGIFLSSATEPFQPIEQKARITRRVLETMVDHPPDLLIVQSHSHHVADYIDLYPQLHGRCELRFHISIETDRERLPGLPPPGSSIENRLAAAAVLRGAGLRVVATVAPLLPIENSTRFFKRLSEVAHAVVIDHYIGGDGTSSGWKTGRTTLPDVMRAIEPRSVTLEYRDEMVNVAKQFFDQVGVNINGFAGKMLPAA